jgi:hypothetical protein
MRLAIVGLAIFIITCIAFLSLGLGGEPRKAMHFFYPLIISGLVFCAGSMIRPTIEHFREEWG